MGLCFTASRVKSKNDRLLMGLVAQPIRSLTIRLIKTGSDFHI